ncbi:MAG: hypothetical protein ACOYMB_01360 [Patescibacteria group bacterium]
MREFDKKQKVAIVALGFVAIFIFFGAAWQFNTRLNKPFEYGQAKKNQKITFGCKTGECQNDISSLMTEAPATATGTPINNGTLEVPDRLLNPVDSTDVSSGAAGTAGTAVVDPKQAELEKLLSGGVSAASLRALMLQSGADATMLGQISDADLLKVYQESLQDTGDSSASSQTAGAAATVATSSPK